MRTLAAKSIHFWVENPDSSWLRRQREWQRICKLPEVGFLRCDYCRFGSRWRKRTRFLTNGQLQNQDLLCLCATPLLVLRGSSPWGQKWTAVAGPYPRGLADSLAVSGRSLAAGEVPTVSIDLFRLAASLLSAAPRVGLPDFRLRRVSLAVLCNASARVVCPGLCGVLVHNLARRKSGRRWIPFRCFRPITNIFRIRPSTASQTGSLMQVLKAPWRFWQRHRYCCLPFSAAAGSLITGRVCRSTSS